MDNDIGFITLDISQRQQEACAAYRKYQTEGRIPGEVLLDFFESLQDESTPIGRAISELPENLVPTYVNFWGDYTQPACKETTESVFVLFSVGVQDFSVWPGTHRRPLTRQKDKSSRTHCNMNPKEAADITKMSLPLSDTLRYEIVPLRLSATPTNSAASVMVDGRLMRAFTKGLRVVGIAKEGQWQPLAVDERYETRVKGWSARFQKGVICDDLTSGSS
jgi:hypothetical protein